MGDEPDARSQADLLQFAKDYVSKSVDLYDVLKIDSTTTDNDIHRAWRRQNLKYHPDKTRDAFDPVIYELVGRAKDILIDPAARKAYDDARSAQAKRVAEAEAMSKERRKWKDELEAAEEQVRKKQEADKEKAMEVERERARMQAEAEEHEKEEREAERREKEQRRKEIEGLEDQEAEIMRRLREKKEKREVKKAAGEAAGGGAEKKKKKKKGSSYMFSSDPLLTYEEKVEGVLGKLREAQERRDAAAAQAVV